MGTHYNVTVVGALAEVDTLRARINVELSALTASLSSYDDNSELMRFNRVRSTDWIAVSVELYEVAALALEVARLTDGAFDITAAPLVALWGFGPATARATPPDAAAIEAAREHTGYHLLEARAEPPALRKASAELAIDVSGIAKGYAVDRIGALLLAAGYSNWMVEIGGEVLTHGHNGAGKAWLIGIEQPGEADTGVLDAVELNDAAIATSGDYRDYFEHDGRRYGHVIDPRSGWPVVNGSVSASVIHGRAALADALATAALVLGEQAALALAENNDWGVLVGQRDGEALRWSYSARFETARARAPGGSP